MLEFPDGESLPPHAEIDMQITVQMNIFCLNVIAIPTDTFYL
ncbi:hypothetical protein PE36_03506 [Moritella sp. PE36]|nr:hypothetical protein PE36_03506 [Moritella sp. PE36]